MMEGLRLSIDPAGAGWADLEGTERATVAGSPIFDSRRVIVRQHEIYRPGFIPNPLPRVRYGVGA